MPFERPTLPELIDRNDAEIGTRLSVGTLLRRSVLGVFSRVIAGMSHMLHGHLDWNKRQLFPDQADDSELDARASTYDVQRKAAAFASGSLDLTFTASGVTVKEGTVFRRSDGIEYATDAEHTSTTSGVESVAVTSVTAGASENAAAGVLVAAVSPIRYLESNASVEAAGITGGADEESDDSLRARLLTRMRQPPEGGAEHDYVAWAREVPGVTRAWATGGALGDGTVLTVFAVDDDPTGPIPDAGKVAEVQTKIDAERPVAVKNALVSAPTEVLLDPEIVLTPDTAAVRDAVEAALEDLLFREGYPGNTLYLSHIREAISTAAGETDHNLISPVADITYTVSELGTLGTITWS